MDERIGKTKEYIANKFELPKDIVMNLPRILVVGKEEITIENHKGILSFSESAIKVNSEIGNITIEGEKFEILFIGGSTLSVGGVFKSIVYEGQV